MLGILSAPMTKSADKFLIWIFFWWMIFIYLESITDFWSILFNIGDLKPVAYIRLFRKSWKCLINRQNSLLFNQCAWSNWKNLKNQIDRLNCNRRRQPRKYFLRGKTFNLHFQVFDISFDFFINTMDIF